MLYEKLNFSFFQFNKFGIKKNIFQKANTFYFEFFNRELLSFIFKIKLRHPSNAV